MNKKSIITGIIVIVIAVVAYFTYQSQGSGGKSINIAMGAVGDDLARLRQNLDTFEQNTGIKAEVVSMPASTTNIFGQFKVWLTAQNSDIDIYVTDVIWAPQIADHLIDLSRDLGEDAKDHFPAIIESQTVNGRLVALPFFTDAPALYYRRDLLNKYGLSVPKTWSELKVAAKIIQDEERSAGNSQFHGFVWQGAAYEGLTCDALEWVKSHGGGQIVEPDGRISINNPRAIAAIEEAKSWVGTISPNGILSYMEEEARGVWQKGNAAFMRNWPYAYALGQNSEDSKVKNNFDVVPLPSGGGGSAATLGGWNLSVSKYSEKQENAIKLVRFLASRENQKFNAIQGSKLPTIPDLYSDSEVLNAYAFLGRWKDVLQEAVPRPSAPTKIKYNEVSKEFWTAVNNSLAGRGSVADNLAQLEGKLEAIKGGSSW